jgi:hypothetical protein
MATTTKMAQVGAAPAVPTAGDGGVKFSMSWLEGDKSRRMSGIEPSELATKLGIDPIQLQAAIGELITQHQMAPNGRERTPAQKQKEKDYRLARKVAMTDEQRELERTKRQAYNAVKNAEIKQALALLREQAGTK